MRASASPADGMTLPSSWSSEQHAAAASKMSDGPLNAFQPSTPRLMKPEKAAESSSTAARLGSISPSGPSAASHSTIRSAHGAMP